MRLSRLLFFAFVPVMVAKAQPAIDCGDGALPGCGQQISAGNLITNAITIGVSWSIFIIGLIAMGVLIKGGVDFITSMGEEAKMVKARNTVYAAMGGLVLAVLSFMIVTIVANFKLF